MRSTRLVLAAVGAAALIAGAGTTAASASPSGASAPRAATAEIVPNATKADCPYGYFCSYTGTDQSGKMYKTFGNWTGNLAGIKSYYNNANPDAGATKAKINWAGASGPVCVSAGQAGTFTVAHTLTEVIWWNNC